MVLRAAIHFETQAGEPVHAPLVLAAIGAFHTRLILDTGSDVHLITAELAEAACLGLAGLDAGTDHSGSTMDSWAVGDVELELDEAEGAKGLRLRDVVAIPAPAAFTRQGIGGIISPQRLHATAFPVIDEIDDELVLIDGPAAGVPAWLRGRHPSREVVAIARRPRDDRPIVEAAIEPHGPVPVLLNTGGRHTEFEPGTVPGLEAGTAERIGTGVSGAAVMGGTAGPQVLRIGEHRVRVPSLMLRTGMGDPPAMIGQDVLRETVVALGPDPSTPVFWQVEGV